MVEDIAAFLSFALGVGQREKSLQKNTSRMWCRLVILIYLLPDIGRIIECIDDLIEEITVIQNFLMTVISCDIVNYTWQKRIVVDDFQTSFSITPISL